MDPNDDTRQSLEKDIETLAAILKTKIGLTQEAIREHNTDADALRAVIVAARKALAEGAASPTRKLDGARDALRKSGLVLDVATEEMGLVRKALKAKKNLLSRMQ